jgi:hypothetical protein
MSLTSYASPIENERLDDQLNLLDLDGLRQIVAFLDALQVPKGEALDDCVTDPSQGMSYD